MLNFEDVLNSYPAKLRGFKANILKEYLQYKILDIIYSSKYARNLIFLGGTAIRIVHQGIRFSEDIDFDNTGLNQNDFQEIALLIKRELSQEGYVVEMRNVFKGAYRCYIKFPGILFEHVLTGHKQERILIQVDAQSQAFEYEPDKYLINKFGIFRYINTVPVPLLLAQKIWTCLSRKREKGRDFFDVVYLMSKTNPDYRYLNEKAGIGNKEDMKAALKARAAELDMKALAKSIEMFLFDPSQKDRVALFNEWLETI
jgi:predicted nucleotidyltransferase component of viral defense system